MSNQTEKLKLFKWDMLDQVDLNSNFDIEKTLNENWDKIDNNAKEIEKQVNGKIDKVEGKELSTNDFTSNYKEKLENLENYDDTEIKQSIEEVTIKNSEQDNSISKMQEDLENLKNIINTIPVIPQIYPRKIEKTMFKTDSSMGAHTSLNKPYAAKKISAVLLIWIKYMANRINTGRGGIT